MNFFNSFLSRYRQRFLESIPDKEILVEAAARKIPELDNQIVHHEKSMVTADITKWKSAIQAALNNDSPDRLQLYEVYDNVMIDNHLSSIIESRVLRVLSSPFKIVDQDGEENTELTRVLERSWFQEFLQNGISSLFWGPTLIELVVTENGITKAALIPRENCNFKKKVIYLTPDDDKGIPYENPPYDTTVVQIGSHMDLGLLMKAAPIAMAKKYALGSWSEYTEKFGIPFRWVTTDTVNTSRVGKLGLIMENMGSAGWGIFKKGEEINMMNTPATSPHDIFDKMIERTNKEMSKLILGQTMTTDDGSSKSQAQVHLKVAEDRHEYDKMFAKNLVNDHLLPRLQNLGIANFTNHMFKWDDTEELNLKEIIDTVSSLSQYYEIDTDFITEKTGIPILGVLSQQMFASDDTDKKKKITPNSLLSFQLPVMELDHCCVSDVTMASDQYSKVKEKLLADVYEGRATLNSRNYYEYLVDEYLSALNDGYSGIDKLDYNKPDHIAKAFMEANLFRFSAAKDLAMVNELNLILNDSNSFPEFKDKSKQVLEDYNVNYLKTEYNFARSVSQNAARYYRQMENIEALPYLIYKTAADNRVRPVHEVLHNKLFKKDDTSLNAIYPPNGWGCRCEMIETFEIPKNSSITTGNEAINLLKNSEVDKNGNSEWDRMTKGRFNINRGVLQEIFDANKMYVQGNFENSFSVKNNGLLEYDKMDKSKFPKLNLKQTTRLEALDWFDQRVGKNDLNDNNNIRIIDFNNKPLNINKKQFKQHLKGDRTNYVSSIEDVISNPDEVYLVNEGYGKFAYRYIKFYQDQVVNVFVRLDGKKNLLDLKSWHPLDRAIDQKRSGVLVYKK